MTSLHTLTEKLDTTLDLRRIPDYPGAVNGLQLTNSGQVRQVFAAVDACLATIKLAVQAAAGQPALLIVHHGMFWNGAQPVTGALHAKLQLAMQAELAIYSAHIPLDVHPDLGNNARLAKALGFRKTIPFFPWKGIQLGVRASVNLSRDDLHQRLSAALEGGRVHICPGGPERIRKVGIITGGAGSEIAAAAAQGIDTFISGEGPHWSYTAAEELGVNLFYGGHYATETFGVKAAAEWLSGAHRLPWSFIDHPTGL